MIFPQKRGAWFADYPCFTLRFPVCTLLFDAESTVGFLEAIKDSHKLFNEHCNSPAEEKGRLLPPPLDATTLKRYVAISSSSLLITVLDYYITCRD